MLLTANVNLQMFAIYGVHTEHWKWFPRLSRTFLCAFSRTIHLHFHVFPGLFNWVAIEQVRLAYTCTKSITLCNANIFQLTIHGSEMRQPFCLFSMTFQAWKIWI